MGPPCWTSNTQGNTYLRTFALALPPPRMRFFRYPHGLITHSPQVAASVPFFVRPPWTPYFHLEPHHSLSSIQLFKFFKIYLKFLFIYLKFLFIYLACWVLVVAHRIFGLQCGMQDLLVVA